MLLLPVASPVFVARRG